MRTYLAIATSLALSLPALPAGAAARVPLHDASAHASGALVYEALARRNSPAAAPRAETVATANVAVNEALTLEARQLPGAEAITVTGSAPANAPITITLLVTVSPDVPTILVSRHDVVADATGRFGAVIPIASAYERGLLLTVLATSASGASASAHLVTDAPNAGASVPLITH